MTDHKIQNFPMWHVGFDICTFMINDELMAETSEPGNGLLFQDGLVRHLAVEGSFRTTSSTSSLPDKLSAIIYTNFSSRRRPFAPDEGA
eukprot:scaffold48514_cov55-Attheya_sp.AAC.3